jgi:hypothetical protein
MLPFIVRTDSTGLVQALRYGFPAPVAPAELTRLPMNFPASYLTVYGPQSSEKSC